MNVKILQLRAAPTQGIEVGGFDFAASPADVIRAEVVGEDKDDVGLLGCSAERAKNGKKGTSNAYEAAATSAKNESNESHAAKYYC